MSAAFVYVHVPFCARRCSYCDFSIAVRRDVPSRAFADAIGRELAIRGEAPRAVETLYLGGGTPSQLGGEGVARLLDTLRATCAPTPGAEITLEANPEDVTAEHARAWVAAGINRVSLGVQSFDDAVLRWMHRVHDAAAVPRAVDTLRDAGIADLSVDLIFAVPADLTRDWDRDLAQALALDPTHVSLYGLTIEPGTPLGRWTARGEAREAPEEAYEAQFLAAHRTLTAAGFDHYEVSNYGRPGHHARHNSAYWQGVPYLGLGPSAHGFDGTRRRWNVAAYAAWDAAVRAGTDPFGGDEPLDADARLAEAVYLGLRTRDGLRTEPDDASLLVTWEAEGWVEPTTDGRWRCTPTGWLRLDALAAALTSRRSR
ncbi:MAG TPA: radical SAM family heme chaperone HemW [Gemmatimonadaceae bacterium]|nr:radical SAM family heme chaperone HemW [Gemmatimonadaceae bacterium]